MLLKTRESLSYWLPPLVWAIVILALSGDLASARHSGTIVYWILSRLTFLIPEQIDLVHFLIRKTAHVVVYGVQYFFWFRAFQESRGASRRKSCLASLGLCLLLALVDEAHQSFVKSRTGSLMDVSLDMGGASIAALITLAFRRRRRLNIL